MGRGRRRGQREVGEAGAGGGRGETRGGEEEAERAGDRLAEVEGGERGQGGRSRR